MLKSKPMPLGGLIPLAVLLPNLVFLFKRPTAVPAAPGPRNALYRVMQVLERLGQAAAFVIPFFYALEAPDTQRAIGLGVMAVALLLYYAGWLRYLRQGQAYRLLYSPLAGIPLPMAVCPVVYFLAAGAYLHSVYLLTAAVVLGVGHIYVSFWEGRRS
jgi:hypothetical protein